MDRLTAKPWDTNDTHATLYFFCDDKIQEHRDASAIMRGILHQLLSDRPGLLKRHGRRHFKPRGTKAANELLTLWDFFLSVSQDEECPPLVVIIDAIDECEEKSRDRFLSLVVTFYSNLSAPTGTRVNSTNGNPVRMLITSRPEVSIADSLEMLDEVRLKAEDETESISKDVVLVTQQRLRDTLRRFNPPAYLVKNITEKLTGRAGHTFLWVALMLQMIERSAAASEEALEEILADLPEELDGIYENILARCQGRNRQKARTVLQIIVSAGRSLTLTELRFAMAVRPGDTAVDDLQPRLEPNMLRTLQVLCGPFLKITNSTVMLVHQTAKEFLVRAEAVDGIKGTSWKHSLDPGDSHLTMSRACVLALTEKRDISRKDATPFAWYARDCWVAHLLQCEDKIDGGLVEQVMSLHVAPSIPRERSAATQRLKRELGNLPYYLTRGKYHPDTSLDFASLCGFKRIIERLLEQGEAVNHVDRAGMTPIGYASISGREGAVRLLLERGADPILGKHGAVELAVTSRQPSVLEILLKSGAPRSTDGRGEMALAVETGHEALTRFLLDHGVPSDLGLNEVGETPLIFVAKRGNKNLVKALIAGLHSPDKFGRTALHFAAEHGHEQIVRILMAHGANINRKCDLGETALARAVKGGHVSIARYLLDQGADPNLADNWSSTPLWWAVIRGYETLVTLLLHLTLPKDCDRPGWEGSLGWWARRNGHDRIAKMVDAHAQYITARARPSGLDSPWPAVYSNLAVYPEVEGTVARALVCTGSNATFMSASFAEKCGTIRLIDRRFASHVRGNSTIRSPGRVHVVMIKLAGAQVVNSVVIVDDGGFDMMIGLDFLRRYQCTLDFRHNRLIMPFTKTPAPMLGSLVMRDSGDVFVW